MPEFRNVRTGRTFDIPEGAAASYRRSDTFVEADATPVPAAPAETDSETTTSRPAQRDSKSTWEAWAKAAGHDTDGLTKDDLMELE